MRRTLSLVAAVASFAALPTAVADARAHGAKVQLRQTILGKILVNGRGYTLYAFTPDKRNKDVCAKRPGCLGAWPAFTTSGAVIAGRGVKRSLIGTIKRGHKRQVTYAGHPLYTYVADTRPGETTFVNIFSFNGLWPALNAAGKEVK